MSETESLQPLFDALEANDEKKVLSILITKPIFTTEDICEILQILYENNNVHFLNIMILYGLNCNMFWRVLGGECDSAYIDIIDSIDEDPYYDYNEVLEIIDRNMRWCYDKLLMWYINPIYYSFETTTNINYILKLFIQHNIISMEDFMKEYNTNVIRQYIKYDKLADCICPYTKDLMYEPCKYNYNYYDKNTLLEGGINNDDIIVDKDLVDELNKWNVANISTLTFRWNEENLFKDYNEKKILCDNIVNGWHSKDHLLYKKYYPKSYDKTVNTVLFCFKKLNNCAYEEENDEQIIPTELIHIILSFTID